MSAPDFNRQRLEGLLLSSASRSFPEAERAELNALLRDSAEARTFAARTLTFDANLADCLAASEVRRQHAKPLHATGPTPDKGGFKPANWFAKAAVWIGTFHLLGNTAKAAGTTPSTTSTTLLTQSSIAILMKKAVTSITAAILVLGGSGVYLIHRSNESTRARVGTMEAEIQSLSDELGIKTTISTSRRTGATDAPKTVSVVQVLAAYEGDNMITRQEKVILDQFKQQLAAMDAEALKNLLLDAEKISSPINGRVAELIMDALVLKDPAEATRIASLLIGRGSEFQFLFSTAAAKAFDAWLAKDPAAADAWYAATATAGGLGGKSIAPNGLEELSIDRSFARSRFSKQVLADPAEAAAMLTTMLPADVTAALKTVTDPDALRQILPKLAPAQKGPAAEGAIKAMAASDLKAAFTWAKSLEMDEPARNHLMATGIEAAAGNGNLDLAGVSEWSKDLSLDAKRRSNMLVSAATSLSLIPRENENVIDVENSVYWDRVTGNIDWLRKEAPAESVGEAVGDYLGKLSYNSHNLDKSIKAYESEVARKGEVDPDLTIAFAGWLSMKDDARFSAAALKLLNQLPPSEKRKEMIERVEMNR
jgi:hypothetical protein